MKFDYRGIVSKMKNTLERTYRMANCYDKFFVVMMVFDVRVETIARAEYSPGDMIRLICSDQGYTHNVYHILEHADKAGSNSEKLSVDAICKAFKSCCKELGNPVFSDVYPVFKSEVYHEGMLAEIGKEPVRVSDEDYKKCLIAVCSDREHRLKDDLLVDNFTCFYSSFYDRITIEYLKTFASGVANNLFAQPVSLSENLISIAGVKYMAYWGSLISPDSRYGSVDDFALHINRISALEYETREINGKIIFCDHEFPDEFTLIKFKTPYRLNNQKLVRKLIQIVDSGYCLGATYDKIYGIISDEQVNAYRERVERLFRVRFVKERIWDLDYLGNLAPEPFDVFTSEYENYKYARHKLDEKQIAKAFGRISWGADLEVITSIISSAMKQKSGTMLVFSKDAQTETERLGKTCIPLKIPINLGNLENSKLVQFITSIDGAVMCDELGVCYAIGVILDGFTLPDAESQEDISRGARHNSAYRYLYTNRDRCVIIIISEDGDISIIS